MQKIKIQIELDKDDYYKLKDIAVDDSPEKYLSKYIKKRLFSNNGEINIDKNNDEFKNLKLDMEYFDIKQKDIAAYYDVSQASVSKFLKNENKNSFLYFKFFPYSLSISSMRTVLYDIFISTISKQIDTIFSKNEKHLFTNAITKIKEIEKNEDETEEIIERFRLATLLIIVYIRLINTFETLTIEEYIQLIYKFKKEIINIKIESFKNKDLEYIYNQISSLYKIILQYKLNQ